MKRPLLTTFGLLATGVLVTILIAWIPAAIPISPVVALPDEAIDRHFAQSLWDRHKENGWPQTPERTGVFESGLGFTVLTAESGIPSVARPTLIIVSEVRCGWPMRSMKYEFWGTLSAGGHYIGTLPRISPVRPLLNDPGFFVPIGVIPIGFVTNAIIYAALTGVSLASLVIVRRALRLRGGLCPHCAYPLSTSLTCPECGRSVPRNPHVA